MRGMPALGGVSGAHDEPPVGPPPFPREFHKTAKKRENGALRAVTGLIEGG